MMGTRETVSAEAVVRSARAHGVSPEGTVATIRSITGLGPDVRLLGGTAAVANIAAAQLAAGSDPVILIAEIERIIERDGAL